MIEVEVGGTIVEFPDGTSPDIMKSALQKRFSAPQQAAPQTPAPQQASSLPNPFQDYQDVRRESQNLIGEGVEQVQRPTTRDQIIGAVKVAGGGLGYVASPISAALRTVVGKPIEAATGIPKEYSEFAAGLALPIPKRIPTPTRGASKPGTPTTEQLFEAADTGYKAARSSGVTLSPEETADLAKRITGNLTEAGYRDFLAPKTFRALGEFKTDVPSNVADIEAVRRALNIAGGDPSEKDAVRRAISSIDEFLGPRVPEIADARGNYAAGSRAEAVSDAMDKAGRQASAANSGQNIDNARRQQIKAILNSPKRRRGFSANELAQMETIVEGTRAGDAARGLGNLLGGGGGLGSVVTAAVGGAATGGPGAIAPVFGYAFKKLGNKLTGQQVTKLDEMVRSRAPLAQAVGSSLKDWAKVSQAFEASPSVKNFARLTVASRNLSNNLKGAGIDVDPESLALPSASFDERFTGMDAQP